MNDALRAAVYARDKAICSFSGLSLWYLDHGTAPFAHPDWVDHIKPKSRGGGETLDNLVCASYFYNRKKMNNGSDREYLFSEGSPTSTFFYTHGELSSQQAALLKSHSAIELSDWYFNRAIFNVMVAVQYELAEVVAVRTREYWLRSARKRMESWKKLTGGVQSFESRGLITYPAAEDVKLMLSLCEISDHRWPAVYKDMLKLARLNVKTLDRFMRADQKQARKKVVEDAIAKGRATAPMTSVLKRNAQLL